MVKNLPVMQETQVLSLGWKDPLEKEMAAHFSILSVKVLWFAENYLCQLQRTLKHRGITKICICPWSKQEAGPGGCSNRAWFHSLPIYICSLKV